MDDSMIDLEKYRIIDLSHRMIPGVRWVNGEYRHGGESRRLEIREYVFEPDKMLMHWVDTESHIGTHVEGPGHHPGAGKDLTDLPIDTYMGEAIVLKFDDLAPENGSSMEITPEHLGRVKNGDIVLLWSPYEGEECPYISVEAAHHLRDTGIKMIGIEGIGLEAPGSMASHDTFLLNDIPIIEGLENLERVTRERVFYIGLPISIERVDSSWTRAIVLEER
jgi:arylformamidase